MPASSECIGAAISGEVQSVISLREECERTNECGTQKPDSVSPPSRRPMPLVFTSLFWPARLLAGGYGPKTMEHVLVAYPGVAHNGMYGNSATSFT